VNVESIVGLIVALALMVYLAVTLFFPERF
jgi:K+-transporting ATPase KdpF subunit